MARKLSVVTEATKAPAKRATTIKAAVELPEKDLLLAMRTKVATEIDAGVPAHTLAPLMRQLRELDKEIRAVQAREQEEAERRGDSDGGSTEDAAFEPEAL